MSVRSELLRAGALPISKAARASENSDTTSAATRPSSSLPVMLLLIFGGVLSVAWAGTLLWVAGYLLELL